MAGPTYTYTANTPQAATAFNLTQSPILNNFRAINEWFNVNHVSFNNGDAGKHKFISLPNTTDPDAIENVLTMFTQVTGSPNPCELFIAFPLGAIESTQQISNGATPTPPVGSSGGDGAQGWCSFPSGIILRWGTFATSATSNPQVTIPITQGPYYTTNSMSAVAAPTSYGCLMPPGVTVYDGLSQSNPPVIPVVLYDYTSASTVVNFNYLVIGM